MFYFSFAPKMARRFQTFCIFSLFAWYQSYAIADPSSHANKEIVLVADEWCPYNCSPSGVDKGLLIDIAEYAFDKHGYQVRYVNRPWNRSIVMVRNGDFHGIVGSGKKETPDFVFPDQPLSSIEHTFYVNKASSWRFENLESLKSINLGVIKNYSYGDLFQRYIKPNESHIEKLTILHGDNALDRLVELLKRERIDAFVEEKNIVSQYLSKEGSYRGIKSAGVASREEIYIAFSPNISNAKMYADIVSKGYQELIDTGEINQLYKKYGLIFAAEKRN